MVNRIKGYPRPERPLKVVIAGGGELAAHIIFWGSMRGGGGGSKRKTPSIFSILEAIASGPFEGGGGKVTHLTFVKAT